LFRTFINPVDIPAVPGTFGHTSMPKKSISEPVYDQKRKRWRVTIPESISENNKRVRSWHKSREAARTYVTKITGEPSDEEPAAIIPPMLAMKADEARSILEPFGLDLVEAAREVANALKLLDGAGTIQDAVKAYRSTHEARHSSKELAHAVELYLTSREDLRDSTQKSYTYTLSKVMKPLHDKTMAEIKTADLEALLKDKGPVSRSMHRRNLGTFWKWASSPPRQWASFDTVSALEAPRISNDSDIEILLQDDVRALLLAAETEGPAAAAAYAIAIFGGVRMAELEKLTWGDVRDEYIEIGRAIAKKHSRRLVPICPTLEAWLSTTRGSASKETPIVPPNWIDVSKSVRRRAGWDVSARLLNALVKAGKLKALAKPTRGKWPVNACRHTCASVQVAIGTPLEDLTFKFGHSGGHDMLRRHYVSRLTKKDAIKILSTGPGGKTIQNLAVA